MAHLQDPQGALFAVSSQEQRSRYKDPQIGDFSWHELLTSNWQTAFDFYAKLFGWEKMEAMDMGPQGTYQIFGTGGHQLGGMFNPGPLPPGGPLWIPYVHGAPTRGARLKSAKENGATIAHGPVGSAGRRLGVHRHRPAGRDVRRALEEDEWRRTTTTKKSQPRRREENHEEENHEGKHEDTKKATKTARRSQTRYVVLAFRRAVTKPSKKRR